VRPSAVYGPFDVNERVVQVFIENALLGHPLRLDDPSARLDFTHVTDTACGIALATLSDSGDSDIFNVTRGQCFASYVGTKYAIAVNSCTSALYAALKAKNIRGEVIVPSFTFIASGNAILLAGAVPVFADILPDTLNLDPSDVASRITPRTEAIMVVHYAGQCCDMEALTALAKKHGLYLIEDSAETIGGTFLGRQAGSFGAGCFSFFPTKNLTTGEGGMLTTNDAALAGRRELVAHGVRDSVPRQWPWQRSASSAGFNFRLSNILAAIGVVQLDRLDEMNGRRRDNAAHLMRLLGTEKELGLPRCDSRAEYVYQMFVIRVGRQINRNEFVMALNKKGIEASVHFDPPLHQQELFAPYGRNLPNTETASREVVTIPMYPDLSSAEVEQIAAVLLEVKRSAAGGCSGSLEPVNQSE
jgi:perosamine synthetase